MNRMNRRNESHESWWIVCLVCRVMIDTNDSWWLVHLWLIQQMACVQCVEVLTQRSIKHEQDGFFGESCASAGNNLNLKCLHPWKTTQLTVHNVMRCSGNLTCRRISQKSTHVNKFLQFQWCQTHRKVFLIFLSKQKENSKNALIKSGFGWRMAKTYPTQRLLGFEEKTWEKSAGGTFGKQNSSRIKLLCCKEIFSWNQCQSCLYSHQKIPTPKNFHFWKNGKTQKNFHFWKKFPAKLPPPTIFFHDGVGNFFFRTLLPWSRKNIKIS